VPAGFAYNLFVFDDGDLQSQIFGDNNTHLNPPSVSPLASVATTAVLNPNDMRIFRITNGGDTNTLVVNNVPLSVDVPTPTALVNPGETRFIIWNNIVSKAAQLASPDPDCCNFLRDANSTDSVFTHGTVGNPNTLSPVSRSGSQTFGIFSSSATCSNLGSPIVPATITLNDLTGSGQCSLEGAFVFGRTANVITPTCTSFASFPSTCTNPASFQNVTSEVITDMFGAPTATNPAVGQSMELHIVAPMCDCVTPTLASCPAVCERDEFDVIRAKVDNTLSTLNAIGNSNTADLRTRINSVQSSVNGLSSSTNNDANEILDELDAVRSDVKKIRKDIGDLEDEIKDL